MISFTYNYPPQDFPDLIQHREKCLQLSSKKYLQKTNLFYKTYTKRDFKDVKNLEVATIQSLYKNKYLLITLISLK